MNGENAKGSSGPGIEGGTLPLQSSEHGALLFTTNPGLEDVVVDEFQERSEKAGHELLDGRPAPFDLPGYALVESTVSGEELLALGHQMRSVHHLLQPLWTFTLPAEDTLERLRRTLEALEVPAMERAASFRVSSERNGEHDFTSIDMQRVAGAALQAHYGTPVDLESYTLNVRVDLIQQRCVVSIQHTREALSRRQPRSYQPRAALKPNVAYAMLRLAQLENPPATLLDPFCGSGTILLEAAALWPDTELHGSDKNEKAVDGARRNAEAAGMAQRIRIYHLDARDLTDGFEPQHFDAIITNPPYGVRVGRGINFHAFYRRFLEEVATVIVPGGRLLMLVLERGAFNRVVARNDQFYIRHVRIVEIGGLFPGLFVLERQ